jgi:hypothetical protein
VPRILPLVLGILVLSGCVRPPLPADGIPSLELDRFLERRLTPANVTASEVSIATNPVDPLNVVAAANSAGGFGVYWTFDGGKKWNWSVFDAAQVDPVAERQGRFIGLSDPAVAFGPDGTVYLAGLAYIPISSVFVAKSTDGGASWDNVVIVHQSDLAASFNDKEWIGVSPKGTLIVAWQKEPAMDTLRAVDGLGVDADIGDIVFSRSTDGGRTWSFPTKISRGLHNNGTQIQFTDDGRGHLLWVNYEESTLDYVRSEDDGASWSTPRPVATIDMSGPLSRYSNMHTLPGFAASRTGSTLAAVWHDDRNGDMDIYGITSADGGATWGDVTRINDDPVGNGVHQLYPWVTVDPEGAIHATFYDSRLDPYPRFLYYIATAAGPNEPFQPSYPVSSAPFTAFAPAAGGAANESRGLGHYTGVASSSAGIFAAWADGRGRQSAVYAARIPLDAVDEATTN